MSRSNAEGRRPVLPGSRKAPPASGRAGGAPPRSEQVLELLDWAPVGLDWLAPDGTILRTNPAQLRMLGYASDEYVGRHIAEFHVDRDAARTLLSRLAAGEELRDYPAELRRSDGSIASVLIDGSARTEQGAVVEFRCFTRDAPNSQAIDQVRSNLAAIVESSDDAIIAMTLGARIESWNRGAERLFGYTSAEVIGQPIQILIPANRSNEEDTIIARLLRDERVEHFETLRIRKDGRPVDVSLTVSPIRDSGGRIVGASKIARDITERRQVEKAIRQSEIKFRQLADVLPQMVWTARPDGTVDYFNERWYEYTGFDRELTGDESWQPVLHPDDRDRSVKEYYACIASGRPYAIEYRFKDRRTGGYRWFLGRADPVRDETGEIIRWFGTSTDIDDTRRREEISGFLATAVATVTELTTPDSILSRLARLAVPAFADWCAGVLVEPEGGVRRVVSEPASSPDPPVAEAVMARVVSTGRAESVVDGAVDDEWQSLLCVPLRGSGDILGVLGFAVRRSGRVYDASYLAAADDLAHRVGIALENVNLVNALKLADRRKDEFLAILAHELRSPLAPIQSASEIIRVRVTGPPEVSQAQRTIDRQIGQLTRLVDDLLDVSRITSGKIELRRDRASLSDIVQAAVETCRPLMKDGDLEFSVALPSEPVFLDGDAARLSQALLNLLNNAAKYTPSGGRVSLDVHRTGDEVVLAVRDTGAGISPAMRSKIFGMFTQGDQSLERPAGGLGIGLTLAQVLVQMHGGSIDVHSDGPGKGSEFVIRLPALPASASGAENLAAPSRGLETASLTGWRILVVDDNEDAAESLGLLLGLMGADVRTAHDGIRAVEDAADFRPDAVLMDIGLPRLNGYEAGRQIRREQGPDVLLIAVTGWGQEEDRRRSREAGFNHHLTKPVAVEAIRDLLAEVPKR